MNSKPYPRWFYRLPVKYYEQPVPPNPYLKWLNWIGLFFIVVLGLHSFYEWFAIQILADQAMITDYQSVYSSPEDYATSASHIALDCLPIAAAFAFAIKKGSNSWRLLALSALIAALSIYSFFG
jgi:hypothetical protein